MSVDKSLHSFYLILTFSTLPCVTSPSSSRLFSLASFALALPKWDYYINIPWNESMT